LARVTFVSREAFAFGVLFFPLDLRAFFLALPASEPVGEGAPSVVGAPAQARPIPAEKKTATRMWARAARRGVSRKIPLPRRMARD
jgi:hypothetical protein